MHGKYGTVVMMEKEEWNAPLSKINEIVIERIQREIKRKGEIEEKNQTCMPLNLNKVLYEWGNGASIFIYFK